MYCSRISITGPQALDLLGRDLYQPHKAVWMFFGDQPDRKRDFLFRLEPTPGGLIYYVVSQRPPLDNVPGWRVETKPYTPLLRQGQPLQFSLRVNPVRKVRDGDVKQHRHDVVMDAKRRAREQGVGISNNEMERQAGLAWLEQRYPDWGIELRPEQTRVHSYRKHVFYKGNHGRKGRRVTFCSLDFDGILTVNDPVSLLHILYSGVGCSKGFGCGLMLIRRL